MSNSKPSKIFTATNIKNVVALMMIITLLAFSGCNNKSATSSADGSSSEPSNVDSSNTSNNSATEENSSVDSTVSSENSSATSTSSYINLLEDGEIDTNADTEESNIRTDALEIEPTVDPSDLAYNYKGYAEEARNKRLKEILNTPNTLKLYSPKKGAKVYYVSPGGNNANDGLSPETAIQNIDGIYSLQLKEGDFVLFERNSVYRLAKPFYLKTGITYGSYGKGRKPMLLGSPKNFAQEVWKPSKKKNVWQINFMYSEPTGAFFNEGEEIGRYKLTFRALEKNADFFYDSEVATLYVYCDKGNPGKVWKSIEISQQDVDVNLATNVQHVVCDNLAIRYMGPGSIRGNFNNHYITVTNCEIGYTGGAWSGAVRSGGAIGLYGGGHHLKWDHNWIYQTFDSAFCPQGHSGHKYMDFYDISWCDNLLEYNNGDFELWEYGDEAFKEEGPSWFWNLKIDNNICRFTSLGWGTRADDGGLRDIDGVWVGSFVADQVRGKFTYNNNIIDCPGRMIYRFPTFSEANYKGWQKKGNVYHIKQSIRTLDRLTYLFHWENGKAVNLNATNKSETLAAFAKFEPEATVYWYK